MLTPFPETFGPFPCRIWTHICGFPWDLSIKIPPENVSGKDTGANEKLWQYFSSLAGLLVYCQMCPI
jgi:hypothetical protein